MDDFAPPSGPPPPKAPDVPAGWAARWNEQYKEWFYVNVYTKKSQWEKPTEPVFPVDDNAPPGAPPGYVPSSGHAPTDTKHNPYEDRSGSHLAGEGGHGSAAEYSAHSESDAAMAARLQAEEDARARSGHGGAQPPPGYGGASPYPPNNQGPYGQPSGGGYPDQLPPRDRGSSSKGGFLGKLLGKGKSSAAGAGYGQHHGGGYPQQQYYQQQGGGYYPQQGEYPPQGGYGGGYGGPPMGGGYGRGGFGGGGYGPPRRQGGGGMGAMGGGALGLGAGLLGGALIADAFDDNQNEAYQDGYDDGQDGGGDDGGDDGGD